MKPEESVVVETVNEATPVEASNRSIKVLAEVKKAVSHSADLRETSIGTVMIGYQFLTSWLPSKPSISYTHVFNREWSLEAEYSWATISFPVVGIDLGSIKEKRYGLQARRYVGNSFHFIFGAVISEFNARLGSDFLDANGNEIKTSFGTENVGVSGGMGNRWQWQNGVTLGIDWLRINVPLFETKIDDQVVEDLASEEDRDDITKVIKTFNRIPTYVLFGVNIGYTF